MDAYQWLTGITGIVTALGALGAAGAAVWLLKYARQQAREMLEARYAQSRPLVIPVDAPPLRGDGTREDFNAHATPDRPHFCNIGTGPALNVWVVIFGPRPTVPSAILPDRRTVILEQPVPASGERDGDGAIGRTSLDGDVTLDGDPDHALYAPPEPTPEEVRLHDTMRILARYTITYRDIFGRTHMSIFDYDFLHHWHGVDFVSNIPKGLQEANREQHIARMEAVSSPLGSPLRPFGG